MRQFVAASIEDGPSLRTGEWRGGRCWCGGGRGAGRQGLLGVRLADRSHAVVRNLRGSAAVVLPDHQVVPQHHHPAVLRVVALVAGTLLPPDVELQRHVIMHPQPFSLPPCHHDNYDII